MYVPLRVHGHHSLLTGVDTPATLIERARAFGLPALALADVDTLSGLVDFLHAARPQEGQATVRPIVAAELSDPSGAPGRLIALVRDATGYRNLCKLVSARQLGGDPGDPEQLAAQLTTGPEHFDLIEGAVRYREGLIFLADHPRLLVGLHGHIDPHDLFAAISPAALQKRRATRDPLACPTTRNAHLVSARPELATAVHEAPDPERERPPEAELEHPKVPAPAPAIAAAELVEAARAVGVATIAVPDVYYAFPSGAEDHRVRVAIKHNALECDLPPEWVAEAPAHLPSPAEMRALFAELPEVPGPFDSPSAQPACGSSPGSPPRSPPEASQVPGALQRSLEVAARCTFTPELGGVHFPTIELEEDETAYSKLCKLAFDGARRRYRPLRPEVVRRLDYELTTIDGLGFAPYFLLVNHLAEHARRKQIPCVGRGSAADSLVAYCLALTDADPLRYGLLFERFLNPSRRDRPDIDLDFCWRRRDEVIEHLDELFAAERTAMISTLNHCGLRSAFREAALALGIPPVEVNRWSRRLPHHAPSISTGPSGSSGTFDGVSTQDAAPDTTHETTPGTTHGPAPHGQRALPPAFASDPNLASNPIALAFLAVPEAAGFPFADERFAKALRIAARLVDTPRHFGLHPGGVVVAPGPITDYVSCQRAAKGVLVTQLDKDGVEAIGLVKMDLLGNRALTVVDDCVRALAEGGIEVDLETIAEDDPRAARLLRAGRTIGCFQVESPGMRNLLKQIGASTMDDVIQAVALIRPGPAGSGMKDAYIRRFRKREEPTPPHPRLTDVLWDTHGVMLYQEDVMRVAERIAGMDLSEADLLRRALQKRRSGELAELRVRFVAGAREQGIERAEALTVWDLVANFASFGFCKAHAVTYGRIAYRTVWLKAHYPAVFLAAFLGSQTGYYATRVYVEEARRLGVAILGPDINKSGKTFSIEWLADTAALRVGLGQVKGLSRRTLDTVLGSRSEALFLSLPDFLQRTRAHTDETENLIRCGAFDAFDRTQPELLWRLHLLRAPERRAPRGQGFDLGQLAACRETPKSRQDDTVRAANAGTGGWSQRGLGLGQAKLAPGQSASLFSPGAAPSSSGASLFATPPAPSLALPRLPDVTPLERGRVEYELLGLTVRAHPTRLFPCPSDDRLPPRPSPPSSRSGQRILPVNPIDCYDLDRFEGGRVTLRGWPAASRRVRTENGRWMRFVTLEDETGLAEVVLFPDVYERDGRRLAEFGTLCITGRVEDQLGACTLHAERVW